MTRWPRHRDRCNRALALSALALAGVVILSCGPSILEELASGFFTLSVAPTSVSISPTPDQGTCGTDHHVIITLTQGIDVGKGTIHLRFGTDVVDVGMTLCTYESGGVRTSNWPTITHPLNQNVDADVQDGESRRYDLIFRPSASATPGTYSIRVNAIEEGVNRDDVQNATVLLTILPPIPPTVSIMTPADGSSITTSTVTLTGTADDDVGVESLAYRLNGGAEQGVTLAAPITAWTLDVPGLTLGANTIEVLARDGAGLVGSASVTVTYDLTVNGVACNQMVEATLALNASADQVLQIPPGDLAYATRIESVDLEGTYEFPGGGPQVIQPGERYDRLDYVLPGTTYAFRVSATTTGGIYRLYLECERPFTLNTDVTATQPGGLPQLYRFADTRQRIHIGVHRPQVVYDLVGDIWLPNATGPSQNPLGNPTGGYWSGFSVDTLALSASNYTLIIEPVGAYGSSDVEDYTFALSTVSPPASLTLGHSNSTTVTGVLDHLGHLAFYSFQGVQGQSYTVTVTHPSGDLAAEVTVSRMGPSGTYHQPNFAPLESATTTRNPVERTAVLGPFTVPADDTYIIRLGANADPSYDAALSETIGAYSVQLKRN